MLGKRIDWDQSYNDALVMEFLVLEAHIALASHLGLHLPPTVTLPRFGSISMTPPPKLAGKSFARSSTKYGLDPLGNVNRSKPARRVVVASIWISLSSVNEK